MTEKTSPNGSPIGKFSLYRRPVSNAGYITSFWDLLEKKGIREGMCE